MAQISFIDAYLQKLQKVAWSDYQHRPHTRLRHPDGSVVVDYLRPLPMTPARAEDVMYSGEILYMEHHRLEEWLHKLCYEIVRLYLDDEMFTDEQYADAKAALKELQQARMKYRYIYQ